VAGLVTVLGVSLIQNWTPILQPWAVYPAPLVGCAIGLVAGLYPAWRASRIEPASALRPL
jgi:putative ABC transport system permease protein